MRDTVLMLLGAAVMLSLLFVLIRLGVDVVYIVIGLYCLGGASALATLLFHPCWSLVPPLQRASCQIPCVGDADGAGVASAVCSVACMLVWVLCRHLPWAWVAQDLVGVAMCMLFCRQISIPSVRVAAGMGVIFLVYDVVMVFLTPLIVGSSVMIDVATAGAPVAVFDQACYCRLNPDDWSVCGPGERMPILFAVPRMLDYRGGYSLLGLGDIVIPGLIVTLALRLDLALHKGWSGLYWVTSIAGYAAGLASAQAAASLSGSGQPALLYIIPFVTAALMLVSRCRGEFGRVWLYGADSPSTVARRERRRRRGQRQQPHGAEGAEDGDDSGSGSDSDTRGMLVRGSREQGESSHAPVIDGDDIALVSGTDVTGGEGAFMGEFTEAGRAGATVLGDGDGDDDGDDDDGNGPGGRFHGAVDEDLAGGDLGSGTGQIWGAGRGAPRADAVGATAVELSELVSGVGKDGARDELL
jgi:signal peptide peptidase-like protein 2B